MTRLSRPTQRPRGPQPILLAPRRRQPKHSDPQDADCARWTEQPSPAIRGRIRTIAARGIDEIYISNWYIMGGLLWTIALLVIAYLPCTSRTA